MGHDKSAIYEWRHLMKFEELKALIQKAKEEGFQLSAEAMTRHPKSLDSLGADELELVVGGGRVSIAGSTHINNWSTYVCGCKPPKEN
jgi:phosphosulfolactate synthase (CoM biosynthesis protein A)